MRQYAFRIRSLGMLLLLAAASQTAAQTESGIWDVPRTGGDAITEPSPEATAMRRYQDYPVSHATGTADVSIPLLELHNGRLGVSLGLRYHTGGIKKTDIATSVGLGWSLAGLGCVSRQINGFPDEWRGYGNDITFDLRITSGVDPDYLRSVLEAKKDVEYDCYNYSVDGHSGSFYIVNGAAVEYPPSEMSIMFSRKNPDNTGEITKFEIYSPEGTVYTFEEKEYIDAKSYSTCITQPLINRDFTAVSQWNLTKIESIYERSSIIINYTPRREWTRFSDKKLSGYSFIYNLSERKIHSSDSYPSGPNLDERTTFRNHSMPASISTDIGSIEFTSCSLSSASYLDTPADYISGMMLKDASGHIIKSVNLDNTQTFRDGRRKLTAVNVASDGVTVDRYRFSYNDQTEDFGYDLFGYPNGKGFQAGYNHSAINSNLEPSICRQPETQYIADNCLTEIRSVTGLCTKIKYEPATINITPFYDEYMFNGNTVLGPRIKRIETKDTVTGRVRTRSYEYHEPVCDIPLDRLIYRDFISQSGVHSFFAGMNLPSTYSLGVTFLPSAALRGVPVENARLYYGRVVEKLDGTDISHPIITEYEYDLSDIGSGLKLDGCIIPNEQHTLGDNPEDGKSLGSLQNCDVGMKPLEKELIKPVSSRGYMSRTFGNGPLLKRKVKKEWTAAGYRICSIEENFYSKTDQRRFVNGLYCESVVFRYEVVNGPGSTLNITNYNDVNYFYDEILSYRTVCDSTVRTTYYPDNSRRSVTTAYINRGTSGNGRLFPGFNDLSIRVETDVAFSPLGVVVSCGDESISTYTARVENVDTEQNFNVMMTGLRKLPALEKWVTRTSAGSDSVLRQTNYGMFGSKVFVRPSSVWTGSAERIAGSRTKISEQIYSSYDERGRVAAMKDAAGRDIEAEWDNKYNLLKEMRLPAATLTNAYTHIPLVGCTSITLPSGKKRQFAYEAGRLVSEKNTSGQTVASYSYSLYGEANSSGKNLITSTVHDDTGDATESTFYDGFGMAVRTLSTVAGGSQTSTVTSYDALDRPVRQDLPVPATEADDAPDPAVYYGDPYPYKSIVYRNLTSDKPLSVISEGTLMQDHPACTEYLCNSTGNTMLRCRRYRLAADTDRETITADGFYPAGALDVVRATDADGHVSLIFTDWRGFRILERRVVDASTFADTYFLYDPMGRLRVTLQPEGAALMTASSVSWDNSSVPLTKYAFTYRYDRRGNCIRSLVPGGGTTEMRYDTYNRLAFRSTAAMAAEGRTEFTLYDRIGRTVVTGIADCDIPDIDTGYDMTALFSTSATGIDGTGYEIQDTGLSALLGAAAVSIANYYDGYGVAGREGYISLRNIMPGSMQGAAGLLTATRQAIYSDTYGVNGAPKEYQYALFTYDSEERQVVAAVSGASGNECSLTTTAYSRLGYVNSVTEKVIIPDNGTEYTLSLKNTHDPLGNITKSEAALGSERSEISYSYDTLGRKSGIKLHPMAGSSCTYTYDMRGRIKTIVSPGYSQELQYEDGSRPCYNGSISSERFGYEFDVFSGAAWYTDNITYSYDGLNRLVSSVSSDGYDTSYAYDLNSSPVAVVRKGLMSDGVTTGIVDDLTLTYDGNRLKSVSDLAEEVNIESSLDFVGDMTEYGYDVSGRMESWSGPGEVTVIHAPNDMPVMISSDNAAVRYRYRADGTRLSSAETVPGPSAGVGRLGSYVTQKRYDIGSFRFYNGGDTQPLRIERVSLPWGYFDAELQANVYLTDYQGNIRAVYNQSRNSIVQQTDYYPYGLPKATSSRAEANPYKYGGKELNTDLQQPFYDFSARLQLPQLGIFQRPDPKADDYSGLNPYTYCGGDPINFVDKDGQQPSGYEAALMASAVYKDEHYEERIIALKDLGWYISAAGSNLQKNHPAQTGIGLQSMVFERKTENGMEYSYVYAGTNSWEDAVEDITQIIGLSPQYTKAIENAQLLNEEIGSNELTFVGHSLGGGQAAAASMATGRTAITFNPAAVSTITKAINDLRNNGDIINYISSTPSFFGKSMIVDYVTIIQNNIHIYAPGNVKHVPVGYCPSHSINRIVEALSP